MFVRNFQTDIEMKTQMDWRFVRCFQTSNECPEVCTLALKKSATVNAGPWHFFLTAVALFFKWILKFGVIIWKN